MTINEMTEPMSLSTPLFVSWPRNASQTGLTFGSSFMAASNVRMESQIRGVEQKAPTRDRSSTGERHMLDLIGVTEGHAHARGLSDAA
jgi:hypothetical protein